MIISKILQVKSNQQRVLFILSANHIDHILIDLADPINQKEKELMFSLAIANDKGLILAPQIFNEETYCGVLIIFNQIFCFYCNFISTKGYDQF